MGTPLNFMLHYTCNMECDMSIGASGRIVLEVDPYMKRRLYSALAGDGLTLKAWFTKLAAAYIEDSQQGHLFDATSVSGNLGDEAYGRGATDVSV